jgi:hypothetical protein
MKRSAVEQFTNLEAQVDDDDEEEEDLNDENMSMIFWEI